MTAKFCLILGFIGFIAMLTGCSPVYQTKYTYSKITTHKMAKCAVQCMQNRLLCQNTCFAGANSCNASADLDQMTYGFSDYSGCTDSCGCAKLYRVCYENCGGHVTAKTVCTSNCKKQITP